MNAVYPVEPASILVYNVFTEAVDKFHQTGKLSVDPGYLSQPELIKFKVKLSDNMIAHAYGYYYRPKVWSISSNLLHLRQIYFLYLFFLEC